MIHATIVPKGRLLIIGGHEEKVPAGTSDVALEAIMHIPRFEILGSLINALPRTHHIIEIIAAASSIPAEMEEVYRQAYKSAGYDHVGIIRIDDEREANDPAYVTRIHYAHAVFFTGGDQQQLTQRLNGSVVLEAIRKKYFADPHFIVAGTSAGAMSLPEIIIERGVVEEALLKNDLTLGTGFGFISEIIIDTHFIRRGRFGRLAHAIALHKPYTGIGLGENGALLITNGNEATCLGSGMVIIIDSSTLGATNVADADPGTPIAMEQLKVHILAEGCRYLIREKQFFLMNTPGTK